MIQKILLVGATVTLAMLMAGCGTKGCSTAVPGNGGATSGGVSGGSTPPAGGCSVTGTGGSTNNAQRVFVYFMDDDAGQIAAEGLNVSTQGLFAPLAKFVTPQMPAKVIDGGIVIVNKKYLYVALDSGAVYGFAIDGTTGALSPLNNSPYAVSGLQATQSPFSIAADPAGNFVFVGDAAGITVFAVNSGDGSLTTVNATPASTGIGGPMQMATDGLGKYLYLLDGISIGEFAYDGSGKLTSVGTLTSASTDLAMMTGEPSGKWMLGTRAQVGKQGGALDYNVYVFSIGSNGALVAATPTSTPNPPSYIVVSPNDQFVYTFNENDTSTAGTFLKPIVGFSFNSGTGALTNATPFPDVLSSIGHIDQSGAVIFAVGQSSVATSAGTIPISVLSDGSLSASTQHAGGVSFSFAVTDAP